MTFRRWIRLICGIWSICCGPWAVLAAAEEGPGPHHTGVPVIDPQQVLGHETCVRCHGQEIQVWQQTPHAQTFDTLHRRPEANQIAQRMGIRSIKRGGLCIECHYTPKSDGESVKPISGVSCERCHGAARDWINIHSDYGGLDKTKETETPEHRRQRFQESIQKGMRNPVNVYLIARSCYQCHTVPHEKLVNVGQHVAGTAEFEFVSWSQGTVRHNFLRTNYASNAVSERERLRVMYVVGLMTDLEFSLRATGNATHKAAFGVTAARRAYNVRRRLADLQEQLQDPRLEEALKAAYAVKLKSNNLEELTRTAEVVGRAAYEFAEQVDGGTLDAIDAWLPSPEQYK